MKESLRYSIECEKLLPGLLQQLTEKDGEEYDGEEAEIDGEEKGKKVGNGSSNAYRRAIAASEWTQNSSSISELAMYASRIHRYTVLKDKRDSSITFQTSQNIEYQAGRILKASSRNDMLTLLDYASLPEIENSQTARATVDLACNTYITAARIRSHLKNANYKFAPNKAEKNELDRMEDLFAMAAQPACVVLHPGTKTLVNKHAQEAVQALWGIYNERAKREKLPLQNFVSARGTSCPHPSIFSLLFIFHPILSIVLFTALSSNF